MTLRIALNLLSFRPGVLGGGETFMRELTSALHDVLANGERLVLIFGADSEGEWSHLDVETIVLPLWTANPIERVLKEQLMLPLLLSRHHVDALIMPANAALVAAPVPQVAIVHDLSAQYYSSHFPEAMSRLRRSYVLWSNRQAVRHAARIIVPSKFSRTELIKHLKADPESITVVPYAGPRTINLRPTPLQGGATALDKYGLQSKAYLLTVASKSKHKNTEALISAWRNLDKRLPHHDLRLVLVGRPGYGYVDIAEAVATTNNVISIDDHISSSDLELLYRHAAALAVPSLYEGWGLPVLEGMARGIPVACSSAASLPEVAGDAAVLFDPLDVGAIEDAIVRVLNDPSTRNTCIRRGLERARQFTWTATARSIMDIASQTASSSPRKLSGL